MVMQWCYEHAVLAFNARFSACTSKTAKKPPKNKEASLPLKCVWLAVKGMKEVYGTCLSTCQVILLSMLLTDQQGKTTFPSKTNILDLLYTQWLTFQGLYGEIWWQACKSVPFSRWHGMVPQQILPLYIESLSP